jgi:cell division protein FtsX
MSTFLYLERELLGAIRARSALLLTLAVLFLFTFLAAFSTFFLFPAAGRAAASGDLGEAEVIVHLSPRLSATTIDDLHDQIQARPDVLQVQFRFPETLTEEMTGGRFEIVAQSPDSVDGLVDALVVMDGVTSVEAGVPQEETPALQLSSGVRIGLLCWLAVSVVLALLVSRRGFRTLLDAFRNEIRLLRLSGIPERLLYPSVVTVGLLMGALAGLLVLAGLYLFQAASLGQVALAENGGRIWGIGLLSVLLGLMLGGLIGLFGASHLSSRRFDPLP